MSRTSRADDPVGSHNHSTVDTSEPFEAPTPPDPPPTPPPGRHDGDEGDRPRRHIPDQPAPDTHAANTPLTHSPDAQHLGTGAGTAAAQTAQPRMVADLVNGGWDPAPVAATTATTGTPGTYGPVGAVAPANRAALSTVTASPLTKWVTGAYIVTADTQESHWSGTAWTAGRSPV